MTPPILRGGQGRTAASIERDSSGIVLTLVLAGVLVVLLLIH